MKTNLMRINHFFIQMMMLILVGCINHSNNVIAQDNTVLIPTVDGLEIKADFYQTKNTDKPLILLFHQAGYSRGEYIKTGVKLKELGFSSIAIDQRSGNGVNGVENETVNQARKKGYATDYPDAIVDLEATLDYVKANELSSNGVILVGSSYSASLVFILAALHPSDVKGIAAFSPGEYFEYDGNTVASYAKQVSSPVFITSAKSEKGGWASIYENIESEKEFFLPESKGFHGSKALWEEKKGHEEYWNAFSNFLDQF